MDHLPQQEEFNQRRKRIAPEAYDALFAAVSQAVDDEILSAPSG